MFFFALLFFISFVESDDKSVRYAVIADLSRDGFTANTVRDAILLFTNSSQLVQGLRSAPLTEESLLVINSNGSLLTALQLLDEGLNDASEVGDGDEKPSLDAVFVADRSLITKGIVDYLSQPSIHLSDIPVFSLVDGNDKLCTRYLQVICVSPFDSTVIGGMLHTAYEALSWEGLAVILEEGVDGREQASIFEQQESNEEFSTVTQSILPSSSVFSSDTELMALLSSIREAGVAAFVSSNDFTALVGAWSKGEESSSHFFIGNYMSLNNLGNSEKKSGQMSVLGPNAALFVPHYTSAQALREMGLVGDNATLDELGAYVLSYLLDAIRLVREVKNSSNISAFYDVQFSGLTGTVGFDKVGQNRIEVLLNLVTSDYPITSPLISYLFYYQENSTVQILQPSVIDATIPASPLSTATVCLAAPPDCADISQAISVFYSLRAKTSADSLPTGINFKLINTGLNGVDGFVSLAQTARQCTFLLGAGYASIDITLSPVVNEFGLTQIDYQASDSILTNPENRVIPTFSRTVLQNKENDEGIAEICKYFGWERVVVITSGDSLGQNRAADAMEAMASRNVYVEKLYNLEDISSESLLSIFSSIYEYDVSRIIFLAISLRGKEAEMVFDIIDQAPFLRNYVLLLDPTLCLYGALYPQKRNKIQSSLCLAPQVANATLQSLNEQIASQNIQVLAHELLSTSGFFVEANQCSYTSVTLYNGFALDASTVVMQALAGAVSQGVSLYNSSALLPFVRNSIIDGASGQFSINSDGDRSGAAFVCNIQVPEEQVVSFATWNKNQKPSFRAIGGVQKWVWMTNSTDIPLDTFRDASFLFKNIALSSPGLIAISAVGFFFTFFVFFMCYRHYRIQRQIEIILSGNTIPITRAELKHLRQI